jgi:hypothetical protein
LNLAFLRMEVLTPSIYILKAKMMKNKYYY